MQDGWKDQEQDRWIREELKREAARIEQETKDIVLPEKPGDREALFGKILESVRREERRTGRTLLTSKERDSKAPGEEERLWERRRASQGKPEVPAGERPPAGERAGAGPEKEDILAGRKSGPGKKRGLFALKAASVLLVVCVGIFGISMTSEGNRLWVMEKVGQMFGSGESVNADNDQNRKISDTSEREAREMIEEELGIPVPEFFYLPDGTEFVKAETDYEAGEAAMLYSLNEEIFLLQMSNSREDKAQGTIYDGKSVEKKEYSVNGIEYAMTEGQDSQNETGTIAVNWQYKNHFYEFSGRLSTEETLKILEGIRY